MIKYNLSAEDQKFVSEYRPGDYDRPSVTTDILIFTVDIKEGLQLLLIKRKNPPFRDFWAIPGGFVDMNEDIDEGAKRELFEETNVKDVHLEQLYTFGEVGRDPRMRIITIAYMALVPKALLKPMAGDDAAETEWVKVGLNDKGEVIFGQNNNYQIAFDHANIIKVAIERLRGKLEYTTIATNLLNNPQKFAIYELQKIHEAILGHSLNAANFRRYFLTTYIEKYKAEDTGIVCAQFSKRPSHYYKLF